MNKNLFDVDSFKPNIFNPNLSHPFPTLQFQPNQQPLKIIPNILFDIVSKGQIARKNINQMPIPMDIIIDPNNMITSDDSVFTTKCCYCAKCELSIYMYYNQFTLCLACVEQIWNSQPKQQQFMF